MIGAARWYHVLGTSSGTEANAASKSSTGYCLTLINVGTTSSNQLKESQWCKLRDVESSFLVRGNIVKRQCPYCGRADSLIKSGRNRSGTQRYKCVCGRTHTRQRRRNTSDLTHLAAALLHRAGYSLREVSSVLSLSHQAVKLWSEQYGSQIVISMDSIYDMPCFTLLANRVRYDEDDDL